jgi:hypothetical protein
VNKVDRASESFFRCRSFIIFDEIPSTPAVKSLKLHLLAGQNPAEDYAYAFCLETISVSEGFWDALTI